MPYLKQLSLLFNVCFLALGVFQLGVLYGNSPYRALVAANGTKQEFLQIAARQNHTLLIVAAFAVVFALLNVTTLVLGRMQARKEPTSSLSRPVGGSSSQ